MKLKLAPVRLLFLGYFITILLGTILLVLPFASKTGSTSFIDALFTATSATCVTGLIPFDTFTHWTMFGQIVILVLIQIGGLGFMTIITLLFMMFGKSIGLYNRTILMQSAGSYNISEINKLLKRILIGTLIFELGGAIILTLSFSKDMSLGMAIYRGVFHSVSAFCNAGFDTLGATGGSLTDYYSNPLVLGTLSLLIVVGGSGFIFWSDLIDKKFKFKKLELHSKIVLVYNIALILIGQILFIIFEFTNFGQHSNFSDLSVVDKMFNSLFLSVSPRTAGFNALDLNLLTSSGKLLTIILMFIGGNSGSTAGGLKVTTLVIIVATLFTSAKGHNNVIIFKRKIPDKVVKQSSSLFVAYMFLVLLSTLLISMVEDFTFEQVLFEVVSALGTVGLSLGVSAGASIFTKIVLILLMYAGRLGALALFSVFFNAKNEYLLNEPEGRVLVG
ncbi:MAG: Trk family potassium uptake protein [Gammaproteobacteria bacterium]|nr:Trk family potassium uptake protein [Gammaproteobacteria bacterium]